MVECVSDHERLVELVRCCPALYDTKSTVYRCKTAVNESWHHIATTLGRDVKLLKQVWMGLRSSYARHLQNQKKGIKRAWYLSEKLDFLREHMKLWPDTRRLYSKPSYGRAYIETEESNVDKSQDCNDESSDTESCLIIEDSEDENEENDNFKISNQTATPQPLELQQTKMEMDSEQITDEREQSISKFFQSIIFDLGRLSDRNLRLFRHDVYETLNKYLDAEEMENSNRL